MRCPECGAENSSYRNFCYQCAHPLTASGQQVRAGISGANRPAPTAPPLTGSERPLNRPMPVTPPLAPQAPTVGATPVTPPLDSPPMAASTAMPMTPSLDSPQSVPPGPVPVTPPLDAPQAPVVEPMLAASSSAPQPPLETAAVPSYPRSQPGAPRPAAPSTWSSPHTWTVLGLGLLTMLLLVAVAQLGLRAMARPAPDEVGGQAAVRATSPSVAPSTTPASGAAAAPPTQAPAQPTAAPTAAPTQAPPPVAAVAPTSAPLVQAPAPTEAPPPTAVPPTTAPRVQAPLPTVPPPTQAPPPAAVAPPAALKRAGETLTASRVSRAPTVDGALNDWPSDGLPVNYVVYAQGAFGGPDDLQARVWLGWDDQALYVATRVQDDVLSQPSHGSSLYLGDSVEIQLDADLAGDFDSNEFDGDDWHIGLSPGNFADLAPEAYVWTPKAMTGAQAGIRVAARPLSGASGYTLEAAIPWRLLNVKPGDGQSVGFTFSISDDDSPTPVQEAMLSTSASRQWHRPQTFNTLVLER